MSRIRDIIHQGGIIAYPTEAVFGLGCDPQNQAAVIRLCELKQRSLTKGLILIASSWQQLAPFVEDIPHDKMDSVNDTWPGPTTWLFPASCHAPKWICGDSDKIAVRITNHPLAKALCDECDMALVSTSANLSGQESCRTTDEVKSSFKDTLEAIVDGDVGSEKNPSRIFDAISGTQYR